MNNFIASVKITFPVGPSLLDMTNASMNEGQNAFLLPEPSLGDESPIRQEPEGEHENDEDTTPVIDSSLVYEDRSAPQQQQQQQQQTRTAKALQFLHQHMTDKPLSFNLLVTGKRKQVVATTFFELLVLRSRGAVHLEQAESYGDISITRAEHFDDL